MKGDGAGVGVGMQAGLRWELGRRRGRVEHDGIEVVLKGDIFFRIQKMKETVLRRVYRIFFSHERRTLYVFFGLQQSTARMRATGPKISLRIRSPKWRLNEPKFVAS